MAAKATRLVALLDHTKIGVSSITSFAPTDKIDVLITDNNAPTAQLDIISERDIELIVV